MDNLFMSKLVTISSAEDLNLNDILDSEIIVFEDVQGSKILMNWDGNTINIKPKSINADPINMIDLALQKFYNKAYAYFNSLDTKVKSLLNKKWWFTFEYFPDNQPANVEYQKTPKNNLVLTGIYKGSKFDYSIEELIEFSTLLDVDCLPVMFKGTLNEHQIEAIKYFLNTSPSDLEFVFGDQNFAFFFYKLLNPVANSSFCMEDDFQANIEKLIIRTNKNTEINFQILNPLYKRISDTNSTEFVEIYSLILANFLLHCQTVNLSDIKLKGKNRDSIYINLICKLYNAYVEAAKNDLINFEFVIPQFFNQDKFKINSEFIDNKTTKALIEENVKLEYIFKIILGSLNKKRKKPIGVFTDNTLILFNNFIDSINKYIDNFLNKKHDIELGQSGLLDFGQFFDIKYDTDADGKVYPNVADELEGPSDLDKKKDKKGAIIKK